MRFLKIVFKEQDGKIILELVHGASESKFSRLPQKTYVATLAAAVLL